MKWNVRPAEEAALLPGRLRWILILTCLVVTAAGPGLAATFAEHIIATDNLGVRSVSAADVDGDGDMDFLSASADDNKVRWYENLGGSPISFDEHLLQAYRRRSNFVRAADMNGDGRMDIVSSSGLDDTIVWYENDGGTPPTMIPRVITEDSNGVDTPPPGFSDGIRQLVLADLDGDNDLDVAAASVNDDRVAWYENMGGLTPTWTPHVVTDTLDGARAVYAADLDGDMDVDLVAGGWFDNRLLWFENDGLPTPTFTERTMTTFDNRPGLPGPNGEEGIGLVWQVYAADLDGDDDLDVLGARMDLGVEWYENDGGLDPTFTRRIISSPPDAFITKSVYALDVDRDGDIDPMAASTANDKIAWYENDGSSSPQFTEQILTEDPDGNGPLTGIADGARAIFAADMDGDGDSDILFGSKWNGTIGWYENDIEFLLLGDMDGDGNVDFDDTDDFVLALNNPQDYKNQFGVPPETRGDMDGDGDFDFDDTAGFIAVVNSPLTGEVQNIPEPSVYVLSATALLGFLGCGWRARKR